MSMSKKDFIALADALRPVMARALAREHLLRALCGFMRAQNPRFMEARWMDYLYGKRGPNGGLVGVDRRNEIAEAASEY